MLLIKRMHTLKLNIQKARRETFTLVLPASMNVGVRGKRSIFVRKQSPSSVFFFWSQCILKYVCWSNDKSQIIIIRISSSTPLQVEIILNTRATVPAISIGRSQQPDMFVVVVSDVRTCRDSEACTARRGNDHERPNNKCDRQDVFTASFGHTQKPLQWVQCIDIVKLKQAQVAHSLLSAQWNVDKYKSENVRKFIYWRFIR